MLDVYVYTYALYFVWDWFCRSNLRNDVHLRRVLKWAFNSLCHPEVALSEWWDVKIQLLTNSLHACFQDSKNKKADRKSSIGGFFSRLSRAVLKPRNTTNVEHNILQPSHSQDKGKNSQLHSDLNDKENYMDKPGDPKRSSKRMGRFRLPKYSAWTMKQKWCLFHSHSQSQLHSHFKNFTWREHWW